MSTPRSFVRPLTTVAFLGAMVFGVGHLALAALRTKSPLQHLMPPENVAATTRAELRGRMSRHGNVMSTLLRAVVLLDRPTVGTMARRIADEELLARADSDGLDMWRPLLPKAFFVEQDALRSAASALAQSARQGDPDSILAERFAAVTATCVRCHGSYLHDPPSGTSSR